MAESHTDSKLHAERISKSREGRGEGIGIAGEDFGGVGAAYRMGPPAGNEADNYVFLSGECNLRAPSRVVWIDTLPERIGRHAARPEGPDAMTDIERQRIVMMATTAIAAVVWAIANLA